ncbi:hypothetical protein BC830DRAFT_303919 [Chytriomyces sp. MP71]|nr:hypothetical protein BC830DRAFT_303919 [Chytriomyces sp. MP71]
MMNRDALVFPSDPFAGLIPDLEVMAGTKRRGSEAENGGDSSEGQPKKRPGRKPKTDEAPTKRIAQLRANTKAFRERKEKYVKDLEATVAALQSGSVAAEVSLLKQRIALLEAENAMLRQMQGTFVDPSVALLPVATLVSPVDINMLSTAGNVTRRGSEPSQSRAKSTPINLIDTTPPSSLPPHIIPINSSSTATARKSLSSLESILGIHSEAAQTPELSPQTASLEALFLPPNYMLPLQFETFADTHKDLDINESLFSDSSFDNFMSMLSTPIAVPPTVHDIIEPHFAGLKKALLKVPSLALHANLVETLVQQYIRYTEFGTQEVNPYNCRVTLARLKAYHGRVLAATAEESKLQVTKILDAFRKTYIPDFDRLSAEFDGNVFSHVAETFKKRKSLENEKEAVDQLIKLYSVSEIIPHLHTYSDQILRRRLWQKPGNTV